MSSSNFASFSPYTPPPDQGYHEVSYQSGGVPTFGSSYTNISAEEEAIASQNQWETTSGLRVDLLAGFAYILGPISALILLILETRNDFVRFHAYQSALLSSPMLLLRVVFSLLQFPAWMRTGLTLVILIVLGYFAGRAYLDASATQLNRYGAPYVGDLAERWVETE